MIYNNRLKGRTALHAHLSLRGKDAEACLKPAGNPGVYISTQGRIIMQESYGDCFIPGICRE